MFGLRIAHKGDIIVREQDRAARLRQLYDSLSAEWGDNLVLGSGNVLESVPTPMIVGLIRVARLANNLCDNPENNGTRNQLRNAIDSYLRDVEILKGRYR